MFFILLSVFISALYFSLDHYHFGFVIEAYEVTFNPALLIVAFAIVFFAGVTLSSQFHYFRDLLIRLKHRSLQRRLMLHKNRVEFEREATLFLLDLSHLRPTWVDYLSDSYYRPNTSFKADTQRWQTFVAQKDFVKAYDLIKNAEPYLPKEYISLWLRRTIKLDLESLTQESNLRRVFRRVPASFYNQPSFLEIYASKLALLSSNKEALSAVNNIPPHLITTEVQKALWYWMREDGAYWFQQLKRLWSYNQVLSPDANVLMIKLALSTDFVSQAREYLERLSPSSDKFYLEHVLSLQADKRIELLSRTESWKK